MTIKDNKLRVSNLEFELRPTLGARAVYGIEEVLEQINAGEVTQFELMSICCVEVILSVSRIKKVTEEKAGKKTTREVLEKLDVNIKDFCESEMEPAHFREVAQACMNIANQRAPKKKY